MATWKIEPTWKKSLREVMYFRKDDKEIVCETGWRWGEFTCETEDDNPPVIEEGVDLYSQGYDIEMQECTDGCWVEYEFTGFTEEEEETMREWLDENSFFDLEEDGWMHIETEMILDCEPSIELIAETDE
jgi:hypothetical protein